MKNKKLWKILIVDNDAEWVERYKKWIGEFVSNLKSKDYFSNDVKLAYDGEKALNIVKEDKDINIVIADVFMQPNCNEQCTSPDDHENPKPFGGIWLAKEILTHIDLLKENGDTRDISCLLISDKRDAGKYLKKWISKEWEEKGFVKFVDKFPADWNFKEEFFNKTYIAFVEIAKISKTIPNLAHPEIITISPKMKEALTTAESVSDTLSTVLLLGESGTGKELVARHIHNNSPRKDKPFVAINCAAIPENILESELFGVIARYPGFHNPQPLVGKFQLANGGTIFLDEIGELTLISQAKFLRVLQEKEFIPIGDTKPVKVDIRVIVATNQNLKAMVEERRFREDLYYRINIVPINLLPLTERREDIPLLIDYFLEKYNRSYSRSLKISANTKHQMISHHWKGNVRELEKLIEGAVAVSRKQDGNEWIVNRIQKQSQPLQREDSGFVIDIPDEGMNADEAVKEFQKKLAETALKKTGGNVKDAYNLLKLSESTFRRWCKGE